MQVLCRALHRQKKPVNVRCEQLGGHPRKRVLFMGNRLAAELVGLADDRPADIAAGPHDNIRPKALDDRGGARPALCQQAEGAEITSDVFEGELALDSRHLDRREGVACLGDEPRLHPLGVARKQHLGAGVSGAERIRDRERGVDMSGGTAAGEQDFHVQALHS